VPYELDEKKNWGMNIDTLKQVSKQEIEQTNKHGIHTQHKRMTHSGHIHMPIHPQAVQNARVAGKLVRGMVFINPGNPTGVWLGTLGRFVCFCSGSAVAVAACGWVGVYKRV